MQTKLLQLAAAALDKPILMERSAITFWAGRIRATEPRVFKHRSGFAAIARKMVTSIIPVEDEISFEQAPLDEALAYSPHYIGDPDDGGFGWTLKDGVALLCVEGPLLDEGYCYWGDAFHGYDTLLRSLREAASDPRVGAIFLKINSPGGYATGGIVTLAKWMRENRAAAGGKPIHVYAKQACSAAQWIAAQADKIICPEMAYVGSIGAYNIHCDLSGFYEKEGIKITDYAIWENKTDGVDWKPMSEGGAADALADIDQVVKLFAANMVSGRPQLTFDALKAMRSRAFFSRHDDPTRSGLALGLVDEIASEEDAFHALAATLSDPAGNDTSKASRAGRVAKEKPMAVKTGLAARKAALVAQRNSINAQIAKLEGDSANPDQEAVVDPEADPENPENPENNPPVDPESPDEEGDMEDAADAQAIAATAEAQSNPALALAAIEQGMSLKQFKAMAKATGGRQGKLSSVLSGTPRLGPDGPAPQSLASDLDPNKIYAARKAASRR